MVDRLQANADAMRDELAREGFEVAGSSTQIIPLVVGDAELAMQVCEQAIEAGVFAQAIRPPTVPAGTSRLRLAVMATHSARSCAPRPGRSAAPRCRPASGRARACPSRPQRPRAIPTSACPRRWPWPARTRRRPPEQPRRARALRHGNGHGGRQERRRRGVGRGRSRHGARRSARSSRSSRASTTRPRAASLTTTSSWRSARDWHATRSPLLLRPGRLAAPGRRDGRRVDRPLHVGRGRARQRRGPDVDSRGRRRVVGALDRERGPRAGPRRRAGPAAGRRRAARPGHDQPHVVDPVGRAQRGAQRAASS